MRGANDGGLVAVVDDDRRMREAAENLLLSAGFLVEGFASAEDLLRSGRFTSAACVVLDVQLPGMNGLELQRHLRGLGLLVPVIFVTASDGAEGRLQAQALSDGALAFLGKPCAEQELLGAVRSAMTAQSRKPVR